MAVLRRAIAKGVLRNAAFDLSTVNIDAGQQQEPFNQAAVITPTAKLGIDTPLLSFDLEKGFCAVITGLTWNYTGAGFIDGSPVGLILRLMVDGRIDARFGAMSHSLGSAQAPFPILKGIVVGPGQNVQIQFNIPPASPISIGANTQIYAAVYGVRFPLRAV